MRTSTYKFEVDTPQFNPEQCLRAYYLLTDSSAAYSLYLSFCPSPKSGHTLTVFLTRAALVCGAVHTDTARFPGLPPTDCQHTSTLL